MKTYLRPFSVLALCFLFASTSVRAQFSEPVEGANAKPEAKPKPETPVPGRWSLDKANAWYSKQPWLIGCNYLPATAINQLEMFQADTFDLETMDKELGWAEDLGFNVLRVYLHDLLWEQDEQGLYQRMDKFLSLCSRHGIRVLFVFFDDCHRPDPKTGKQPPCVKGFHNSGWAKSPATELLIRYHDGKATEAEKKRLQGFVQETMKRFRDDQRVLAWELYNEPGRSAGKKSVPLLRDAWKWAREVAPSQPVCSSAEGSAGEIYIEIARANSDVISFHCYQAERFPELVKTYKELGRPALCTEYMARPGSTFQNSLPILKENRIAAFNWGFVSGKSGTVWPWSSRKGKDVYALREQKEHTVQPGEPFSEPELWFHDIYRIDGTPFSQEEVDFIKKMTGKD
jgi:hypothetical protein